MPDAIQSEVFLCRNVNLVADARRLPFPDGGLKAIVMTDVFHHIPNAEEFLREAVRCLRPEGRIRDGGAVGLAMVEAHLYPSSP